MTIAAKNAVIFIQIIIIANIFIGEVDPSYIFVPFEATDMTLVIVMVKSTHYRVDSA
jgi:hypothetical protein